MLRHLLLLACCGIVHAAPIGSRFTFQGELRTQGALATGLFDFQACLYATSASATPLTCAPDFVDVPVEEGRFALPMDLGTVFFNGEQRFVEVRVRPGDEAGAFVALLPRHELTASVEALHATSTPWSGLTGVPSPFADGIDDIGTGTVASVGTGFGLIGGPITTTGQLAVDPALFQRRIATSCPAGQYLRGVAEDGSVECAADATGSAAVTSVTGGTGLTGGTITSTGTLAVDFDVTQARLASSCAPGTALRGVSAAGVPDCVPAGAGTVTQVATGSGLVGGPITGSGTIGIQPGGVGLAHIDPTQVQARVTGLCEEGSYLRGIAQDGSVVCDPLQPGLTRNGDVDGDVGHHLDMALTAAGHPVVSYHDLTNRDLKLLVCLSPTCSTKVVRVLASSGDVGTHTSVALTSDGRAVVTYRDETDGLLRIHVCADALCTSGTGGSVGLGGESSSIAMRSGDLPVVAHYDGARIAILDCNVPSCTSRNVRSIARGGPHVDIAVRSDDRPMIAYRGEFGEVATYSCSDIDCTTGTLGGVTVGDPSHGTGIALSLRDDDIGVVSYSSDGDNSLMLAVCADTNCTSAPARVIDVPASQDTAVAVAGLLPRVAYGGGGTVGDDDMRLYVCSNSTCSVGSPRIVEASSGFYSAVAVRADGRPVVAYRSSKTGDVRIHVCSNAQCN